MSREGGVILNRDRYEQRGWNYLRTGTGMSREGGVILNRDRYEQRGWSYL